MAERYQNALTMPSAANNAGAAVSRWIVEFLTQVVGWTLHDSSGANWTATEATGTNGATSGSNAAEIDITGDAYNFTGGDVGKFITLPSISGTAEEQARAGIYRIASVTSSKVIEVNIDQGVHVDGLPASKTSLAWRLWSAYPTTNDWAVLRAAYSHTPTEPNFDVRLIVESTSYSLLPRMELGPYGNWNAGTNSWDDSRNISKLRSTGASGWTDIAYIWASADDTHFTCAFKASNQTTYDFISFGELLRYHPTVDTNPSYVFHGFTTNTTGRLILAASSFSYSFVDEGSWLAEDDATTVPFFMSGPKAAPGITGADGTLMDTDLRKYSEWSGNIMPAEIPLECRTAMHMELRGEFEKAWLAPHYLPFFTPFGANQEFLNTMGGFTIPWNGSRVVPTIVP